MTSDVTRVHLTRLRRLYRSAGWPCHDGIELDLLAAGYVERHLDVGGRECLSVTTAGVAVLHRRLTHHRGRLVPHEELCRATGGWQASSGRLAFLHTRFRVKLDGRWRLVRPDVISIRHTTAESFLQPSIFEVKARRADLLRDLANKDKRAAYQHLASTFSYVVAAGIASVADVPEDCGFIEVAQDRFHVLLAPPARESTWSFGSWMALVLGERISAPGELQAQDDLGTDFPVV